ncbi:MAG: polysaccharide biosynthesis protein [Candidatus Bathyarchaeum sp.]|nr:MAG: polysaccharide biosynthesis protein [Candidatus Bathyarchaeum sp.]
MKKTKQVLIMAGGGGHTGFAIAIAQRLQNKATMTFLIPENDTQSQERLNGFGKTVGIPKPRGATTGTGTFLYNFARAFTASMKKVTKQYDVAVSTGSNFCIPPAITAFFKGVPIINMESEARFVAASKTARILKPFSAITVLQWPDQKKFLKGQVVGPVFPKPESKPRNEGYILVTGGTLGYKALFDTLNQTNLKNIVLQTGQVDPEPYKKRHPDWKVFRFSYKFSDVIAGAEVVVTHQGSVPLEAAVYKKPSVIVPNPELKRTFPKEDSEIFATKVGATILSDVSSESLLAAIEKAKNKKVPTIKDGAEVLADIILSF